jgi:hypothetical protein
VVVAGGGGEGPGERVGSAFDLGQDEEARLAALALYPGDGSAIVSAGWRLEQVHGLAGRVHAAAVDEHRAARHLQGVAPAADHALTLSAYPRSRGVREEHTCDHRKPQHR